VSCDTRRDEWLAYALGAAEADERAALESHLASGCPACAGHLAEARAVVGHLPLALTPVAPPARVRDRLLARARGGAPAGGRVLALGREWGRSLAAAALAAAALLVVVVVPLGQRQSALADELAAQRTTIERLRAELGGAMQAVRLLESPRLELTLLASTGDSEAWGRLLRDEERRVWQLYAFALAPLPRGRTYELWLITADDRKIPAGIFDAGADGRASHRVSLAPAVGEVVATAVTDEPAGGSPQPTGSIRLVATL